MSDISQFSENAKNESSHNCIITDPINIRTLLFVEDKDFQMNGVTAPIEATGMWQVIRCQTSNEAWKVLEGCSKDGKFPSVISIDLGIDDMPNAPDRGLQLIKRIRERWQGLPIIVHSIIEVSESIVSQVVSQGASYFYLRDKISVPEYIQILPLVANGFLIYSQKPGAILPRVVSRLPDPFIFHQEYWSTLEDLSNDLTYSQIAVRDEKAKSEKGITARVKRIAIFLEVLKEIDEINIDEDNLPNDKYRRIVVRWYRENKNRAPRKIIK